jgi:N-acetylglucosamine malate deacetylase 2
MASNMRDWKTELTGRVLVLVAHPDDESVAYGALLQKMCEALVVIATDGAPRDPYFWGRYGSRQAYAELRRQEARAAMQLAGVRELVLLAEGDARLEDQRLFLHLAPACEALQRLAARMRPQAIATLAYEGGHPDHDSCSLLAARLGRRLGVPVWETPVYHRAPSQGESAAGQTAEAEMRLQEFLHHEGSEAHVEISGDELERKRAMCATYASQGELLATYCAERELVRPQARYDYARPPHPGRTNYECWQWWMTAREVSARFAEFVAGSGAWEREP